jgi:acyl-CoA thioesterase I
MAQAPRDPHRIPRRRGPGALKRLAGIATALALLAYPAAAADTVPLDRECAVPDAMLGFADGMDDLVEALRSGRGVEIVALGSSSTEGAGVDRPEFSYPARLQAELARRFPDQEIRVVNRGIGGQLAREMLERLKQDVIDEKPSLVIWQTGTNDALARIDPEDFAETLRRGIDRLDDAGIEVMLMDLQYYPTVRNPEVYQRYVIEMAEVAEREDISLFPRFTLMKYWSGRLPQNGQDLWAGDRLHLGRLGYGCVAAVLAEAIEREVQGARHAYERLSTSEEASVATAAKRAP